MGLENAVCLLDQLTGQTLCELELGVPTHEHIVALDMHLDCTITVLICGGASHIPHKRCNTATIGVGCPAFYTVEGLHKLVVEPLHAAGCKCYATLKVLYDSIGCKLGITLLILATHCRWQRCLHDLQQHLNV